jgi:dual specificity protein kinase YAK1
VNRDLIIYADSKLVDPDGRIYVVKRHIGAGNFGQVYEAVLTNADAGPYAMKISKSDARSLSQFEYESQVLSFLAGEVRALGIANFIAFESSFICSGHACLVCDLLGPTLLTELDRRGYAGLPLALIQSILADCLRSLAFIAAEGIIHADLKPENILFVADGASSVKIIDFGSACQVGDEALTYIQLRYYRAPEVVLEGDVGTAIDVWSIGCVAAEMLLGLPLFPAVSHAHLIVLIDDMLGPLPPELVAGSKYFRDDGTIKSPGDLLSEFGEDFSAFQRYFIPKRLDDIIVSFVLPLDDPAQRATADVENRRVFLDLLKALLRVDPQERISAEQALAHPFFVLPL